MSYLTTALLIGILSLDTTIAFQVLLSQPIFSCSILGWLLGDFQLGMEIGAMMQLLWLNVVPVGATVFPEGNLASMVTCALVLHFAPLGQPNTVLLVGIVMGMGVSFLGDRFTVYDRKLNQYFFNLSLRAAEQGSYRGVVWWDVTGVVVYFLLMSLLAYGALLAGDGVITLLQHTTTARLEQQLMFVRPALWGAGIGLTGHMVWRAFTHRS